MKVLPYIRMLTALLWLAAVAARVFYLSDTMVIGVIAVAGVWVQFYFSGLMVYRQGGCIIKKSGNLIKRKTVIVAGNICWFQVVLLGAGLPGIMKIVYPHQKVYIIGYTGRQLEALAGVIDSIKT
ncbi:MAG: hypothetical protein IKU54_00460 [Oscillospiraceae bacterium]|nr:hypothetical protein [Oscillospiraceae bacterium]